MSGIDAVLFDFGDTVFHRVGGHAAVLRAADQLGVTADESRAAELWESIQSRARTPTELARGRDLSPEAHRRCWTDLYRPADVVAAGMAEILYEYEISPASWQPFPESAEVLLTLRSAGVRLGVVSDTGWDIRAVFAAHGLEDLVEVFVLSCEWGAAKPHPALFLDACGALGVAPERTVMVGDNPLTDGGAVGAGLSCLIVPPVSLHRPGVLEVVPRLAGLPQDGAPFRAVLFDWRGTLVADPDAAWWITTAAARAGRDLPDDEVAAISEAIAAAGRLPEVEEMVRVADCSASDHRRANLAMLQAARIDDELASALYELDFEPASHPFYPDAPVALRVLKARGARVAVVSDIHFDPRPEFAQAGIADLVDEFVLSFELGVQKPDPAIFGRALDAVGADPHEAVMVGDRPDRDGAAAELGIVTLLLPAAVGDARGLELLTNLF